MLTTLAPGAPPGAGWLERLRPGDRVDIAGPLGRPIEVDTRSRHLLLVAEGPSVAALRLLVDEAIRDGRSVVLLFGAASSACVYPSTLLPDEVEYVVATGDGSLGHRGSVLDLVRGTRAGPTSRSWRARRRCSRRRRRSRRAPAAPGRRDARAEAGRRAAGRRPARRRRAARRGSRSSSSPRSGARRAPAWAAWSLGSRARSARVARARRSPRTSSTGSAPREGEAAGADGDGPRGRPTVRRIKPAITPAPRPKSPATPPARRGRRRPGRGPSPPSPAPYDPLGGRPIALEVDLGRGLVLANPVIVASGPFGYGVEVADLVDLARLGGLVTRGTTLRPRTGTPAPGSRRRRPACCSGSGLANPGLEAVLERYAAAWVSWTVPVIVNLGGETAADSPRRRGGSTASPASPASSSTSRARARVAAPGRPRPGAAGSAGRRGAPRDRPRRSSPSSRRPPGRAGRGAGGRGRRRGRHRGDQHAAGLAVAADRAGPLLGGVYGGLCGPAIRPVALRVVYEVAQAVDVPVIGIGGVAGLDDVLDLLAVGASAVGVGVAALADPMLPVRLADELADACRARGVGRSASSSGRPCRARPAPPRPMAPSTRADAGAAPVVAGRDQRRHRRRVRLRQAGGAAGRPARPRADAVAAVLRGRRPGAWIVFFGMRHKTRHRSFWVAQTAASIAWIALLGWVLLA